MNYVFDIEIMIIKFGKQKSVYNIYLLFCRLLKEITKRLLTLSSLLKAFSLLSRLKLSR